MLRSAFEFVLGVVHALVTEAPLHKVAPITLVVILAVAGTVYVIAHQSDGRGLHMLFGAAFTLLTFGMETLAKHYADARPYSYTVATLALLWYLACVFGLDTKGYHTYRFSKLPPALMRAAVFYAAGSLAYQIGCFVPGANKLFVFEAGVFDMFVVIILIVTISYAYRTARVQRAQRLVTS